MLKNAEWTAARDLLLERTAPVGTETVPLDSCAGRVLAFDLRAASDKGLGPVTSVVLTEEELTEILFGKAKN